MTQSLCYPPPFWLYIFPLQKKTIPMENLVVICKTCFYNYRGKKVDITSFCNPTHKAERTPVHWNEDEEFYETTIVRTAPSNLSQKVWGNVRMCDPNRGTCKRDQCTFAHGTNEQRRWNAVLLQQRQQPSRLHDYFIFYFLLVYHTK